MEDNKRMRRAHRLERRRRRLVRRNRLYETLHDDAKTAVENRSKYFSFGVALAHSVLAKIVAPACLPPVFFKKLQAVLVKLDIQRKVHAKKDQQRMEVNKDIAATVRRLNAEGEVALAKEQVMKLKPLLARARVSSLSTANLAYTIDDLACIKPSHGCCTRQDRSGGGCE